MSIGSNLRQPDSFAYWRARGWRVYIGTTHSPGHFLAYHEGAGIGVSGDTREDLLRRLKARDGVAK